MKPIKIMAMAAIVMSSVAFTNANAASIDMQNLGGYSIPSAPAKATIQDSTAETSPIQITSTQLASITKISPANYDGHLENFPSRNVTIVVPTVTRNDTTAGFSNFLATTVSNTLKYPYYNTTAISTNTSFNQLKDTDFAKIAQEQGSEIVIMPVALRDEYVQLPRLYIDRYHNDDSSDIHIRASVSALIYYYDTNEGIVHTIKSGFSQTDDSITMPTHSSVWNKVAKQLLDKLPYKRVPTDRDRYKSPGINAEMPVVPDFQVEQPKNTGYSLQGVSVL